MKDAQVVEFNQEPPLDATVARAVRRVARALHDGECPACHAISESLAVTQENGDDVCPECGFTITLETQNKVYKAFAPFMDDCLKIYEQWLKGK